MQNFDYVILGAGLESLQSYETRPVSTDNGECSRFDSGCGQLYSSEAIWRSHHKRVFFRSARGPVPDIRVCLVPLAMA